MPTFRVLVDRDPTGVSAETDFSQVVATIQENGGRNVDVSWVRDRDRPRAEFFVEAEDDRRARDRAFAISRALGGSWDLVLAARRVDSD